MPVVNSCCKIPLRTGTLIIGGIEFAVVFTLFIAVFEYADEFLEEERIDVKPRVFALIIVTIFATAFFSIGLLLFGAARRKPKLMLPFIITAIIANILLVISMYHEITTVLPSVFIGKLTLLGIQFYFTIVVVSYFQSLTEDYGQREQLKEDII